MNQIRFLSAIIKGKWLLDPVFAISQGSIIASILNHNAIVGKIDESKTDAFAISASEGNGTRYSWRNGFSQAPKNSIAVIPLNGPLMKDDQNCGPMGMATIGSIIKEADLSQNIDAIVLHIDSPGGTVDGTEALAQIVKNAKKPVVSFVDGLMASAALWIGSSADETIASTDTDEIGSVGVLLSFMDIQPYWEKKGVKFHTIAASTSPEKVKMWEDLLAGNYKQYTKEVLDPLDEKFMAAIRANRPKVTDEHLTGKVFFARDVLGVFVDGYGTLETAILRASEMATEQRTSENNNLNNNLFTMKQFTRLNKVLSVESLESIDESVSLNAEQLELIEGALQTTDQVVGERDSAIGERDAASTARDLAVTERDAAVAERQTAETARADAETNLTNAVAAFDAIDATVAAAETPEAKAEAIRAILAAKPGAKIEGNLDSGDADKKVDEVDWEAIDNLPHNKAVDFNS